MLIDERQLEVDGTVKIVEKIAPAFKDAGFVFILCQLVIDIIETDSFRKPAVLAVADTVTVHCFVRDTALRGRFDIPHVFSRGRTFSGEERERFFSVFFFFSCFQWLPPFRCPYLAILPADGTGYGSGRSVSVPNGRSGQN